MRNVLVALAGVAALAVSSIPADAQWGHRHHGGYSHQYYGHRYYAPRYYTVPHYYQAPRYYGYGYRRPPCIVINGFWVCF